MNVSSQIRQSLNIQPVLLIKQEEKTWRSLEIIIKRYRFVVPFGFITPKTKLFAFPIFQSWAYLMKVILIVPDEGYSERTWWRLFWSYLMKVILIVSDEGYSERTWWRLFWAYLMKVILIVPDEGYSSNASWALNLISTFFNTIPVIQDRYIINYLQDYTLPSTSNVDYLTGYQYISL